MKNYFVSVVIPTINRGERLYTTLRDLIVQHYENYEIIVVDQTRNYPEKEQIQLDSINDKFTHLHLDTPDVVRACNRGVAHAKGDIILLVDDDVEIPDTDFIAHHCMHYDDASIGGIAGQILHFEQKEPRAIDPRYRTKKLPWMYVRLDVAERYEVESCGAGNFSFRKSVWTRIGGFDETFRKNAFRWESDFCFRLRKSGYTLFFDPEASLIHLYGSEGGCDNRKIHETGKGVFTYLHMFFRNNMYFYLKNAPLHLLPLFLWRLYREHAGNVTYLKTGPFLFTGRNVAFITGNLFGVIVFVKRSFQ
jgi:GT2 family glycosyltransferase